MDCELLSLWAKKHASKTPLLQFVQKWVLMGEWCGAGGPPPVDGRCDFPNSSASWRLPIPQLPSKYRTKGPVL